MGDIYTTRIRTTAPMTYRAPVAAPSSRPAPQLFLGHDSYRPAATPGALAQLLREAPRLPTATLAERFTQLAADASTSAGALAIANAAVAAIPTRTDKAALERAAYTGFRKAADLAATAPEAEAVISAATKAGRSDAARYAANKVPELKQRDAATAAVTSAENLVRAQANFSTANRSAYMALRANNLPEAAKQWQIAGANGDFDQALSVVRAAGDASREARGRGELDADVKALVSASADALDCAGAQIKTEDQALAVATYLYSSGSVGLADYYARKALDLAPTRANIPNIPDNYGVENSLDEAMRSAKGGHPLARYYFDQATDIAKSPSVALEVARVATRAAIAARLEDAATPEAREKQGVRVKVLEAAADYALYRAGSLSRTYDDYNQAVSFAYLSGRTDTGHDLVKRRP